MTFIITPQDVLWTALVLACLLGYGLIWWESRKR